MSACDQLVEFASAGVAPSLRAVDCVAGEMTAGAFNRLFGAEGALVPVLTICLTLYIAFFALSLLTGRSTLGISALTPRMLTLGLVLTFATSWIAYSQVLWNLAVAGPDWVASMLTGSKGSASLIFADRIDIVFAAISEIGKLASAAGAAGATEAGSQALASGAAGMFKPADIMWLGALLLLLGTVGVLLAARIALAVLMALGPIFVVLALFGSTRGLTAGWLKGVVLTALVPLLVVLGGSIALEMLVPVISALSQSALLGEISGRAAMALFLVASVHVALMAMVMKVAVTMVSGWQVFGLASSGRGEREVALSAPLPATVPTAAPAAGMHRPATSAANGAHLQQSEALATSSAHEPASSPAHRRVTTLVAGGGVEPLQSRVQDRARGIGSRFRAASNDSGRAMLKSMGKEKMQ
ncbi:MAG: type IV secretion system protein [Novosphingobium sp.]|nr:type IV secretion system protein [Novosphingobium sp.]